MGFGTLRWLLIAGTLIAGCSRTPRPPVPATPSPTPSIAPVAKTTSEPASTPVDFACATAEERCREEVMSAAVHGDIPGLRALAAGGANITACISEGEGSFSCSVESAIRAKHPQTAIVLLDLGADPNEPEGAFMEKPLELAIAAGMKDVVRKLIEKGANVNSRRADLPVLFSAVESGDPEMVRLLLAAGSEADSRFYGKNPLYFAAVRGSLPIAKLLIEAGGSVNSSGIEPFEPPIIGAAAAGQVEMVRYLLSLGAKDVDLALKAAENGGHRDVIELLR